MLSRIVSMMPPKAKHVRKEDLPKVSDLVWLSPDEGARAVVPPNADIAPIPLLDSHRGVRLFFQAKDNLSLNMGVIEPIVASGGGRARTCLDELLTGLVGKGGHA